MNKVWTYCLSKPLSGEELNRLQAAGESFVTDWTAHEQKLAATFAIFEKRLLIIRVNEAQASASGCSIDKLQRFIKQTESEFGIELLNRLLVAYRSRNGIAVTHATDVIKLLHAGEISADTLVFDTSISDEEGLKQWEQPLKNTWLKKYLQKV